MDGRTGGPSWPAVVRGTALGAILGVLPGGGPTLGAFSAYTLEKKISKHPEEFGQACAFLCGAKAGFITGQNILLDGGAFPGTL